MAALANPWIIKRITFIYLKYIKVKCSVHLIYWDTFLKKKRKKKLLVKYLSRVYIPTNLAYKSIGSNLCPNQNTKQSGLKRAQLGCLSHH